VIDELVDMDWVGRLEEAGAQRLVLLCAPQQTSLEPLLHSMLARRSKGLEGLWQRSDWAQLKLADLLDQPALG
jgi:membrane protein